MSKIRRLLDTKKILLADGATGTNLKVNLHLDLGPGVPWDVANLKNGETRQAVSKHYRSYAEAGSDLILTNTWAAQRYSLAGQPSYKTRVGEINRAGAELLREVVDKGGREIICAGSVGPTFLCVGAKGDLDIEEAGGEGLEEIPYSAALEAFDEQISGLKAGGADLVWIETMSSPSEIDAAIEAATRHGLPYVCCLLLGRNGRSHDGETLESLAQRTKALNVAPTAYGANCGWGPEVTLDALTKSHSTFQAGDIIVAKANCGPQRHAGDDVWMEPSNEMAMSRYAVSAANLGVRIIGGCCGTLPAHIRAMRKSLDAWSEESVS